MEVIAVLLKSFEYWLFYFDLAWSLLDIKFECSGAINLARGVHIRCCKQVKSSS
jgi:hypothetical protein